jgi:fructose-bisphosphate aldolase class II
MTAVNLKTLLNKANKNNYAIAGLVVITWEDALAFTEAADETGIPIILQAGPSCRDFTPISVLGKMFRYLADQTKTPICCHLDHGFTYQDCKEGIDNGFTSVMFDGSKMSLKENIKTSFKISNLAHKYNISVEGEIGEVGYFNGKNSKGTDIHEAKEYASKSKIDAMAISVGNTHLQISKIAKINYQKIIEIQNITKLPLVLHGSSGISHVMRKKIARKTKVAKCNIGT